MCDGAVLTTELVCETYYDQGVNEIQATIAEEYLQDMVDAGSFGNGGTLTYPKNISFACNSTEDPGVSADNFTAQVHHIGTIQFWARDVIDRANGVTTATILESLEAVFAEKIDLGSWYEDISSRLADAGTDVGDGCESEKSVHGKSRCPPPRCAGFR